MDRPLVFALLALVACGPASTPHGGSGDIFLTGTQFRLFGNGQPLP